MIRIFRKTHNTLSDILSLLGETLKELRRLNNNLERTSATKASPAPAQEKESIHQQGDSFGYFDIPAGNPILSALKRHFLDTGETPSGVAKRCGLIVSNINSLFTGKQRIGPKIAEKISRAYGFNKDFLLSGKGNLIPKSKTPDRKEQARIDKYYRDKYGD